MTNNKYKLLLVEDEGNIRNLLSTMLEGEGYQIVCAETCAQAETLCASHLPDLVILDLGLPDRDGLDFLRNLRRDRITPVIVLSARSEEQDKVEALDLGANDYVTKPFGSAELLARVRCALRSSRHSSETGKLPGGCFRLGQLCIDYDARLVRLGQEVVHLTQTEYNILALLSEHCGKTLTYSSILKTVWGYSGEGSVKKLQVNMANIRRKLGSRTGEAGYITNELGVGYRMSAPAGEQED